MKVTYIHHSAFLVELTGHTLLFDYTEGDLPPIPKDKPLVVFASHFHADHFSAKIYDLEKTQETVYVLSHEIGKRRRAMRDVTSPIHLVYANETYDICGLKVTTLQSTDAGVAFWVEDGKAAIYHAGDLNHWYWAEESESWNKQMAGDYRAQMAKLKGKTADVAFMPVDPRLGEDGYALGAEGYFAFANAKAFFPMHFWGDFQVCRRLKESEPFGACVMELEADGHVFDLPEDE